jgi:hypothetical protein
MEKAILPLQQGYMLPLLVDKLRGELEKFAELAQACN